MTGAGGDTAAPETAPDERLRLLGVGDGAAVLKDLARYAEAEDVHFERAADPASAVRALAGEAWDLAFVVLDGHPDEQAAWWSEILSRVSKRPRLVALCPVLSIGFALRATHLGVFEVLPVPAGRDRFHAVLERVRALRQETTRPLPEPEALVIGGCRMVAASPAMLPVFRAIEQVSPSTATVLVVGDSGTGKELVARAIHEAGPRAKGPFVAINCAAIPENLLESELFGHEKGAFTGAVANKIGRFERASGGTLFLDEIGDMSLALQSKILRALQEREIERVGGTATIPVDVRLIAATHRDLVALMKEDRFREDLYYRLAVVPIRVPSLAERGDDLLLLAAAFLREFGERYGRSFRHISDQALELLRSHDWSGHVRELRNVVERAVLAGEGEVLRAEQLPEEWRTNAEATDVADAGRIPTLQEIEARHIARVLAHTGGQIGEAARLLGVHRNTLARKVKEYGL